MADRPATLVQERGGGPVSTIALAFGLLVQTPAQSEYGFGCTPPEFHPLRFLRPMSGRAPPVFF